METLSRYLLPLAAIALFLGGMGLQRWLGGDSDVPAASPDTSIVGNGQPTLVEFGMNTCASCRAMHRVLDELRAAHGERLRIIPVNVVEQAELTSRWKVRAIPTQVLLDGEGREFYRHMGFLSAPAIRERFSARGLALEATGKGT